LQVDVLIHRREFWRPTSTGRLINRAMPASRGHFYRREEPVQREAVVMPGREVWILHPLGEALPVNTPPADVQVILLDGSWREASAMLTEVGTWGRKVRLPMAGPSRYWLRNQTETGKYATVEALMFLLTALGLTEAEAQLRLQFELHVYAGLRTRGDKARAEEFLATSSLRDAMPEVLANLEARRARR
jgi:DTW domain-containing protein YfiP